MTRLAKLGDGLRAAVQRAVPRTPAWRRELRSLVAGLLVTTGLAAMLVAVPTGSAAPAAAPPSIGGCQIFPADNVWNTRIDGLPVHSRSDAWVSSIGASTGLKADFGSGLWEGYPIGIPYTTAPGSQPAVNISFDIDDESDPGQYRLPADAPVEGGGDRHVLVVDRDRCLLTEVYAATQTSPGNWEAGSGAFFDLNGNALRQNTWTSADAAGLPILPGLARYDEIAAGEIAHALRFTAQRTQGAYIWPARHEASNITDPNVPPMGARVRLKSSFNVSSYPAEVRIVLTALQRYGMFLADNGSNWYISGAPDSRWNNDNLQRMRGILGSNLEFVDESSLMVHPDSAQVRSTTLPSCSPRPSARVDTARVTAGRLDVTITAGVGPGAPNNRVKALRFNTPSNARILVNGQQVAGGTRVTFAAGSGPARFVIERINASAGATVPLILEDDCGDWSTFAGGGAAAF